jgi:hypothetical protein
VSKPFKFRYVNEIVGLFVLVVLAAVIAGIFLAGREQGWFLPKHDLFTVLPEDGTRACRRARRSRSSARGWARSTASPPGTTAA